MKTPSPPWAALLLMIAGTARAQAPDDWRIAAALFAGALGPITYDRQSEGSSASGLDPQLLSSGMRLGLEKGNPYGSLQVSLLGRYYQPVQNKVHARYTGSVEAYTTVTDIKAQGFGVAGGWVFFPPAKGRIFHPRAGLTFERDRLSVASRSNAADGATISADNSQSVLYAASVDAGVRWRLFAWPFEMDLQLAGVVPFYANATNGIRQHRARPGAEVGFDFLFTPPQPASEGREGK